MSEIEDLLADVRKHEPIRPRRGSRLALILAGAGVVAAVIAGATLGISATASIAEVGLAERPSVAAVEEPPSTIAGGPSDGAPSPEPSPASPAALTDAGSPEYDASTDLATIPRPPADWSADELANAEVWLEQQTIVADCMLEKGFEYTFTPSWVRLPGDIPGKGNSPGDFTSERGIALWGAPDRGLGEDYDWREAGCDGYAVHVTGMDDAN